MGPKADSCGEAVPALRPAGILPAAGNKGNPRFRGGDVIPAKAGMPSPRRRGVSLVGTMVAVVILLVALIGTSSFRYYAALDGRRADAQTSAARVALMLCESWAGVDGVLTYNPIVQLGNDLVVTQSLTGPAKPSDFTLLGTYKVALKEVHGVNHYATLSWKDVQPGLRALNVVVAWAQRGAGADGRENVDKSFRLTVNVATW